MSALEFNEFKKTGEPIGVRPEVKAEPNQHLDLFKSQAMEFIPLLYSPLGQPRVRGPVRRDARVAKLFFKPFELFKPFIPFALDQLNWHAAQGVQAGQITQAKRGEA